MKDFLGFLNTPPLWSDELMGVTQFELPNLNLNAFISSKIPENIRLGHRVEHIFKQLLLHENSFEIMGSNIQVIDEKITLGEIDFILKNRKTQQLFHVELSYKFYIIDPDMHSSIDRALGPNRKDQFHEKIEKTKRNQFKLIYNDKAKPYLRDLGVEDLSKTSIVQSCCFLAQLFVPFTEIDYSVDPFNTDSVVGYWIRLENIMEGRFRTSAFYVPAKKEWIHQPHNEVGWLTFDRFIVKIKALHSKNLAPMVWIKSRDKDIEKCFVVWW